MIAAGDAVAIEPPAVEPFADGSRGDVADLRYSPGGKNVLHFRTSYIGGLLEVT